MRKSKKTKAKLHPKHDRNKREKIISVLEKNDELNRKHPRQRKTKKFNYLKFKPKNQLSSEVNEKSLATKKNKRTLQTVIRSYIEKKKQPKSST